MFFVLLKQMSQRSTCWSVTINNPTQTDEYNISQARQRGWKVLGQLEKGENNTPHYQLMVKTPQVRFSLVKKVFPRAHIEAAKKPQQLAIYVSKEETRVASLPVSQSMYPTQLQILEWFASYYNQVKKENPSIPNLAIFDLMVKQKIRQGYYLDASVMNPQIRSFIKKFGSDIAYRESLRRQTDRQTSQNLFPTIDLNADAESSSLQEETCDEAALPEAGDEASDA